MTYPEALEYLGQARRFGMKLGLELMRDMARELGDPQGSLRFIHIAGTNGKGSTAAFCESILRAADLRVGLYTSPHLVSVRERIQINRLSISEADFADGMTAVRRAAQAHPEHEPTFFEITTALALWYFGREKVDWVVWETGLGGRLDATNIVRPEICIITNIGLEHQQYLGDSLAEIAMEKAGIIKPGVPVVSAAVDEAARIIEYQAKLQKCEFSAVTPQILDEHTKKFFESPDDKQLAAIGSRVFRIGLIGEHQALNAACAVAAIKHLDSSRGFDKALIVEDPDPDGWSSHDSVRRGLEAAQWPGRFDIVSEQPLIVLDGAHNPAGMAMLVQTWREFLRARFGWSAAEVQGRARVVFASVVDKDISEMAQLLRPIAKEVSLVRLAHERGAAPATLVSAFAGLPFTCYDSVSDVWQEMMNDPESINLVTGSLFLVGEMLARRQGVAEEYRLNERLEPSPESR